MPAPSRVRNASQQEKPNIPVQLLSHNDVVRGWSDFRYEQFSFYRQIPSTQLKNRERGRRMPHKGQSSLRQHVRWGLGEERRKKSFCGLGSLETCLCGTFWIPLAAGALRLGAVKSEGQAMASGFLFCPRCRGLRRAGSAPLECARAQEVASTLPTPTPQGAAQAQGTTDHHNR